LKDNHFLSGIKIMQGGMGIGVSMGSLAGAVAANGGAGTISAAQIGFREPDFERHTLEANLRALGKEMTKAREIAKGKGLIGVNIMTVTQHYCEYVKAAVAYGADYIASGAGLPMELPELVQGSSVKIIPIVSSLKAITVICKRWKKKYCAVPDAVVIEGPKAGGHLGFTKEAAVNPDASVFEEECRKIIQYLRVYGEENGVYIPVITAGGFRTREDLQHQLFLGADAVQAATPFVVTKECDADERFKQAYIKCSREDIVIVKSPVGMPGRAIRNEWIQETEQKCIPPKKCLGCISVCRPDETPYCITQALIRAVRGDVRNGLIFCGADAWKEHRITTVSQVMQRFLQERSDSTESNRNKIRKEK